MASQNVGAKNFKRVFRVMFCGIGTVLLFGVPIGVGLSEPLFTLYGLGEGVSESLRKIAYESAVALLICEGACYCLCGFMDFRSGVLRSLGKSTTAMVITLIGAVLFRILWTLFIFPLNPTLLMAYICYPITWVLTTIVLAIICIPLLSKRIKQQKIEQQAVAEEEIEMLEVSKSKSLRNFLESGSIFFIQYNLVIFYSVEFLEKY